MIDGKTVSITTGCMNRADFLIRALPTWLRIPEVDQVVIVDWCSTPPLNSVLEIYDPRIRIVRVDGHEFWRPALCHNLEWRVATGDWILRLDSDILLSEEFVKKHLPTDGVFWAGDWCKIPKSEPNKISLSGILFAARDDLRFVNGFNERHLGYGYDDDEMYARMATEIERRDINIDLADHLPHGNRERIENTAAFQEVERAAGLRLEHMWKHFRQTDPPGSDAYHPEKQSLIDRNRINSQKWPWSGDDQMATWWITDFFRMGEILSAPIARAEPYGLGLRRKRHKNESWRILQ